MSNPSSHLAGNADGGARTARVASALLGRLCSSPAALPAHWQRRALRLGTANADTELLATLASRHDLVADVDAALLECPAVEVRAAWVRGHAEDPAAVVVALEAEDRTSVLMAAVHSDTVDDTVLSLVAQRCSSNHLALKLLSTGRLDGTDAQRLVTVAAAAASTYKQQPLLDELRSVLRSAPELSAAAAAAVRSGDAANELLTALRCDAEVAATLIERFVEPVVSQPDPGAAAVRAACTTLVMLRRRGAADHAAHALVVDTAEALNAAHPQLVTPALAHVRAEALPTLWAASISAASPTERAQVVASVTAELVGLLASTAGSSAPVGTLELTWGLLCDDDLDDDLAETLRVAAVSFSGFLEAAPDRLGARAVRAALGAVGPSDPALARVLAAAQDRPSAFAAALGRFGAGRLVGLAALPDALSFDEIRATVDAASLRSLTLTGDHSPTPWQNPELALALLDVLDDVVGSDETRWDCVAVCADQMERVPLHELLGVTDAVTAET